jgi:DNA polymerase-4
MNKRRRILHVDMDAFFAAVELKRHPELRGKPVVVGGRGDPQSRGVVSTATYEARAFGIHSGMALRLAWRLCPEAVFLPVDFDTYAGESERFKAILQQFSQTIEDAGIDEAYLDVSDASDPAAVGHAIKQQVQAKTGLTCSVGIAPNKLLAKLASDLQKPAGLTVLDEDDIPGRVWPLPAGRLLGVGPKTEARLMEMGVTTIGELAALPVETLVERGPRTLFA